MVKTHFIPPTLRKPANHWQAQAGFTLVELMAAVAIVGLIAGFGLPAYSDWRASMGVSSAASTLIGHLKQSRHLAIAENRTVTVVVPPAPNYTANGFTCPTNANGNFIPCYIFDRGVSNTIITMTSFGSPALTASPANDTFSFTSQGTCNSGSITVVSGAFCSKITINGIGRAYLTSPCP